MLTGVLEVLAIMKAGTALFEGGRELLEQASQEGRDVTTEELETYRVKRDAVNQDFASELARRREQENGSD